MKKLTFIKRVFLRKFRFKFQKLKKDECNTCASFKGLERKTAEQGEAQRQHMSILDQLNRN